MEIVDRIVDAIKHIRGKRNRAGFETLLTFINRNEPKCDIDDMKEAICRMESDNLIINKGREGHESFYVCNQKDLDVTLEESAENKDGDGDLNNLTKYIDAKFYETIINTIKSEVKNAVNSQLKVLRETNDLSDIKISEPTINPNDVLCEQLKDEIVFLRKEIESKDVIIKLLLEERNVDNTKINQESNTVNKRTETIKENIDSCISEPFKKVEPRKKKNRRKITLLGDSIVRHIHPKKMKMGMYTNDNIFIKSFPGATTDDMYDYCKPSQKYDNNLYLLHTGTNDLRADKSAEDIAENIIGLANELKTNENDVLISTILCRNDELNAKGLEVNNFLKMKCMNLSLTVIDNTCITSNKHISRDGLHLNFNGVSALANNFLKVINA